MQIGIFQLRAQPSGNFPFRDKEQLDYIVYYNLSWVWVNAASVKFVVTDSVFLGKDAYFFSSKGSSNSSYDWIFKVRDFFTSFANKEDLTPLKYHRQTREGSSKHNNYYLFDKQKQRIYSFLQKGGSPVKRDTLEYTSKIYDILSATYYLRTVNFPKYKFGDTISVNTVMDNEIIKLNIVYLGIDEIEHRNKKRYQCYKFKTKGVEGSIFDDKSEIIVWVSMDKNKIPMKIESSILVGSVKAYINKIENNKFSSSIIEDFIVR